MENTTKASIASKLEGVIMEFDYLFQEGAVFKADEIEDIEMYAMQIIDLCNDKLLNIR